MRAGAGSLCSSGSCAPVFFGTARDFHLLQPVAMGTFAVFFFESAPGRRLSGSSTAIVGGVRAVLGGVLPYFVALVRTSSPCLPAPPASPT